MNTIDPISFLAEAYAKAMREASGQKAITSPLSEDLRRDLDTVLDSAERSKAVLAVLMTSLVYKKICPEQDIRKHQQSIQGGYSGRTFDSKYITPFLKDKKFPSMSESGWLTRSLEQKVSYDMNYPGAIKPDTLKFAFLRTLAAIEAGASIDMLVDYLLQGLIIIRDSQQIQLARPQNLSIEKIMQLLKQHFRSDYSSEGASRLPVLALFSVYECLLNEIKRFQGKMLLPLESHTSADTRSGRIGDIDVVNEDGTAFEAVEVKFDIPVCHNIVQIAKEKIQPTRTERYYILSTVEPNPKERPLIEADLKQIRNTHGCQLIVNGIYPTLKYYLRLLDETKSFIHHYVDLLETDKSIKFEHKEKWNTLISNL